jgi:hypothetical protein
VCVWWSCSGEVGVVAGELESRERVLCDANDDARLGLSGSWLFMRCHAEQKHGL